MRRGPIAVFSNRADRAWAAVLTADLVSHGVPAVDASGSEHSAALRNATGVVLIAGRSGSAAPGLPTEDAVLEAAGPDTPVLIARARDSKLSRDRAFQRAPTLALWDAYYQPGPGPVGRRAGGGWANVLEMFGGDSTVTKPALDYVFISYRHDYDGVFVREQLRGALALGGFASWDYRSTERIEDAKDAVCRRLVDMVAGASAIAVVATPGWSNSWTELELSVAQCLEKPIVLVRPAGEGAGVHPGLTPLSTEEVTEGRAFAPTTVAALVAAGVTRVIPPAVP
jgi:hypothetical protein